MRSHDAFREKLLDLAYGELPPREARKVEAHAEGCAECRAELARTQDTRRLMAALAHEPAPERGERILVAAAREAVASRKARRRLPPWLLGASVVAASIVAVGAVSWRIASMRPGPLERPDSKALLGEAAPPEAERGDGSLSAEPTSEEAEFGAPAAPPEPGRRATAAEGPARKAARPGRALRDAPAEETRRADAKERFSRAPAASAPPAVPGAKAEPGFVGGIAPAERSPDAAADVEIPGGSEMLDAPVASGASPSPSLPPRDRAPAPQQAARAARPPEGGNAGDRYAELRAAGALLGEIRTFPGCEGEAWRKVETDPSGRVVRYVREGRIGGRRVRIEHLYGPDGALAVLEVHDLDRAGATLEAGALGIRAPARAEDAQADAPPRCDR